MNRFQKTKEIVQTQEATRRRRRRRHVIQIVRQNWVYFILAVVLATAFFAHETIVTDSSDILDANNQYYKAAEISKASYAEFEKTVIEDPLYKKFLNDKEFTLQSYAQVTQAYDDIKFMGFNDFQDFVGELGWALGLLMYAFVNLVIAFSKRTANFFGQIFLHSTIIFISLFFVRWALYHKPDFANFWYIFSNVLAVIVLLLASYFFVLFRDKKFKNAIREWIRYVYDYRDDIVPSERTKHKSLRGRLVKKTMDNVG